MFLAIPYLRLAHYISIYGKSMARRDVETRSKNPNLISINNPLIV